MFDIIKSKVSLLQVIEKDNHKIFKSGANYKIVCPFPGHTEKSASFVIRVKENTYKCFGCGETGSVIDYYMKFHNLDLVSACMELAEKYGVELPETTAELKELQKQYKANRVKIEQMKANNKPAIEYLEKRGFTEKTILDFDAGYSKEENIEWCNISIRNEYGQIVGRARRKIFDNTKPLWKNTETTKIYEKRNLLFNLEKAKNNLKDKIYIMEGYFDVMSFYEQGLKNAVAYCGARITDEQSILLSKYLENDTIISYMPDSDETGLNVIEDNIKTLKKYNIKNPINIIVPVLNCKDANDVLTKTSFNLKDLITTTSEQYLLRKKLQGKEKENQYVIAREFCRTILNKMIMSDIIEELSKEWEKEKAEIKEYLDCYTEDDEELAEDFIWLDKARIEYKKEILEDYKNSLKTGFWSLDREIKGIRKGEIFTCQARPGAGKTALMLNFALYTALSEKNVILFSQEQKGYILYEKIQAILKRMPIDELNKLIREGKNFEIPNFEVIKNRILIIEKAGITPEYMSKIISLANRKGFCGNTDLVIVDYIQMNQGRQTTKREIMENLILEEKIMAKNFNLAFCNLSQVSRQQNNQLIDEGAAPTGLGMAKESGAIEEGSDYVIGLWRDGRNPRLSEEEKRALKNHIGINVLKTKRGEANKKFEFVWYGDMQIIEDNNQPQNMDKVIKKIENFEGVEVDDIPDMFKDI